MAAGIEDDDAQRRQKRSGSTKELRRDVERIERQLATAEATVADLQRQLADPELYQDNARVQELVARHDEAKDRAHQLMEAWTEASLALERADAAAR